MYETVACRRIRGRTAAASSTNIKKLPGRRRIGSSVNLSEADLSRRQQLGMEHSAARFSVRNDFAGVVDRDRVGDRMMRRSMKLWLRLT
jgi:hypothetical protein